MKTKAICLTLLLMLTVLCQFAPRANANDGDWNETYVAEWWWKYVFPDPHPNWVTAVVVSDIVIGATQIVAGTQDTTNAVVMSFQNTTKNYVKCDGSVTLVHTIRAADGSVKYSQVIARALLPASMAPGQTVRIRGTAYTPAKLRGLGHYLEVQER